VKAKVNLVLLNIPMSQRSLSVASLNDRGRAPALRLSPAASLVLDVARFAAALAVLLGHLTLPSHSSGLPNLMSFASGAVGVFFVLSGFVIRYATTYRVASLAEYIVDRVSRLFSVMLPALLFTVLADLTIRHLSPQPTVQAGNYLLRIAATICFAGQIWSLDLTPYLNMPFWSLSFEAFYYGIYGFAFYLRGWWRAVAVCAGCLLAGPSILFMAPIWFFGCFLQDAYQWAHQSAKRFAIALVPTVIAGAAALGALIILPHAKLHVMSNWVLGIDRKMKPLHMHWVSTWSWEVAIPLGVALFCTLLVFQRIPVSSHSRLVRCVRFVADGTFALYLFHSPMLDLVSTIVPYDKSSRIQLAAVFLFIVTICILLERPCLMLKNLIRERLLLMLERKRVQAVPVA
jgi:peptidoglycan/LPS O-acetylase OafA/YrhL